MIKKVKALRINRVLRERLDTLIDGEKGRSTRTLFTERALSLYMLKHPTYRHNEVKMSKRARDTLQVTLDSSLLDKVNRYLGFENTYRNPDLNAFASKALISHLARCTRLIRETSHISEDAIRDFFTIGDTSRKTLSEIKISMGFRDELTGYLYFIYDVQSKTHKIYQRRQDKSDLSWIQEYPMVRTWTNAIGDCYSFRDIPAYHFQNYISVLKDTSNMCLFDVVNGCYPEIDPAKYRNLPLRFLASSEVFKYVKD